MLPVKAAAMIFCMVLPLSVLAQNTNMGAPPQPRPQVAKPSPVFFNGGRPGSTPLYAPAAQRPSQPSAPRTTAPLAVRAPQPLHPTLQQLQANADIAAPKVPVAPPAPEHVTPAVPLPDADAEGALAVDYRDGQLSVVAEKAQLGKVLHLLGSKIGASIEVASDVAREPVVVRLGPGAPNQVLSELLDSPHLAYIVMGSDEDGQALQRIVVRKRASFGREPLAAVAVPAHPKSEMSVPPAAGQEEQTAQEQPAANEAAQPQDNPPRQ